MKLGQYSGIEVIVMNTCKICAYLIGVVLLSTGQVPADTVDVIIRNGLVYDGSGRLPVECDLAIKGDTIVALGQIQTTFGRRVIDAKGLAVAPGFINMFSWATESLIEDGRSQSDIRQGVTLEVFGESSSGPLTDTLKSEWIEQQGDIKFPITWTTLSEYLNFLEKKGISPNIASFVGAGTVRANLLHYSKRQPTPAELDSMKIRVRQAMEEGALGVTCALIYTPDVFMTTEELVALAKVVAQYDGMFIAHIRSEGDRLLEAIDEFIHILSEAKLPGEIYHLKAAGKSNWIKINKAIAKIDSARNAGVRITADMYTYIAGATGLDAAMPPWVQEGGYKPWAKRLKDPAMRERVKMEMNSLSGDWENLYSYAGPEGTLLRAFKSDSLKPLTGKTLAEVAQMRGKSPEETAMDLVIEDGSRVGVAFFLMTEENVEKQIKLPWVSFCSDEGSYAPEGVFLKSNPHPRAYGNFARLLGKYVRDEKLITLEEAIRRLTSFPAENLKIKRRGFLKPGYFADVVVFDPEKIQDHATFEQPHQYSTGVSHVFVNGVQVLNNGEHTGAKPGRVVRGPGWKSSK
jgi:N-acyl-D-amino-acid deacylase